MENILEERIGELNYQSMCIVIDLSLKYLLVYYCPPTQRMAQTIALNWQWDIQIFTINRERQ